MALRLMVSEADDCTYVLPVNVLGQLWGAFNGKNPLPAVASSTLASLYETRCHIPLVAREPNMRTHSPLFLLIGILALCLPASLLACEAGWFDARR